MNYQSWKDKNAVIFFLNVWHIFKSIFFEYFGRYKHNFSKDICKTQFSWI